MIQKHNAFILKKFNWRQTSIIATFFTDGLGKIDAMLKAARVTPQRFVTTFDLYSYNEIIYYKKRSGLHLVVECYLKENFPHIRKDIKASFAGAYFMELISNIVPVEETNLEVFNLTKKALSCLNNNTSDSERIARLFELHLLSLCGFRPHIESCVSCQKEPLENAKFSLRLGGLICKNCFHRDRDADNILKGSLASMRYLQRNNWESAMKLKLDKSTGNELKFILNNFLRFHLETAKFEKL